MSETPPLSFHWLTPGGMTALDLMWLDRTLFHKAFHVELTAGGPRLVQLRDPSGAIVERAVASVLTHGIVLTCHGGPATRAELTRLVEAAGGRQEPVANLWERAHPLAVAALADIPSIQGDLGVEFALRMAGSAPEVLRRALSLPDGQLRGVVTAWLEARFLYSPPRVQLWGPVNAGKSSLLNALCGETLAAVGPQAGLTRDVIEGSFETSGLVVRVLDAPGEPENESALDAAAYALARQWRAESDLTLELVPPGREPSGEATMVVFSRADEDPAARTPGISAGDRAGMALLRREIGLHFIGRLLALPEELRVALPRALLVELSGNPDPRAVLNRHVES